MTQAPAKTKIQLYTMMLMQYLLFAVWWVPLAVYLSNIGITGNDKTLILSTMALGSMASPILGALADRYFAAQKVLAISNILTTCLILLSSTISNPQILFVVILLTLFCYIPTWSLTSSIAMRHAPAEEFPRIRMFGTIGWVLSGLFSIAAYQLFDISAFDGSKTPFYCGAIIAALAIPLNFALPNTPPVKSKEAFSIKTILGFGAMSLYKDRNYLIFTLASILSIIPFAMFFTFGAQFLSNFDFQYITFTMNLAQVTEIFFLFLATSIILKLGIKTAISIGLATILVRYFLFYLGVVQDMQALFILSILMQGIIFGLLYVGGQVYTDKAAPVQIKAQAQGLLFFMIWGVGLMIANYICGSLISFYQDQPHHGWDSIFLITTLISALPLGLFVLLFKKEKNTPTPTATPETQA